MEVPMTAFEPGPTWTYPSIAESVRRRSLLMEVLGGLLILYGILALGFSVTASFISIVLVGGLLLAAGVTQIAATIGYWIRRRRALFVLGMILGVLCALAGILCLAWPAQTLGALTFILGLYFLVTGMVRLAVSAATRFPGWAWGVASAVAEALLGILILSMGPAGGMVVVGTLLGVQLIMSGISAVATGAAVRRILSPRGEPPGSRPATRFQH
jgi:membrane protein HdeD